MWVNDIFDVVKFLCGVKSFKVNWILDGLGDRVIFLLYFSVVLKNVEVEEEISWLVIVFMIEIWMFLWCVDFIVIE